MQFCKFLSVYTQSELNKTGISHADKEQFLPDFSQFFLTFSSSSRLITNLELERAMSLAPVF